MLRRQFLKLCGGAAVLLEWPTREPTEAVPGEGRIVDLVEVRAPDGNVFRYAKAGAPISAGQMVSRGPDGKLYPTQRVIHWKPKGSLGGTAHFVVSEAWWL